MKPQLNILIPQSVDCKTLIVQDISIYPVGSVFSNGLLEVTVPGFDCPVVFDVTKNFSLVLSSSNLKISQSSGINSVTLPDGIYDYKFSIDPNNTISVTKSEMRVCKLQAKLRTATRRLFAEKCNNDNLFRENLSKLNYIENLINASYYMMLDNNNNKSKSIALYNEASDLLKDIESCEVC